MSLLYNLIKYVTLFKLLHQFNGIKKNFWKFIAVRYFIFQILMNVLLTLTTVQLIINVPIHLGAITVLVIPVLKKLELWTAQVKFW